MDENADDGCPGYTWSGGEKDVAEAFDGAGDIVSVRDGDIARSKSGGGSVWNVFRAVERASSCWIGWKGRHQKERLGDDWKYEPCS